MNGPEDDVTDWLSTDWQQVDDDVRRLRQRIFTASQAGDLKKVRNLQKLMLRSRANALHAVRRVTEVNAGRKTAGVDDQVVLTAPGKAEVADWVQRRSASWTACPVRRVYVPKPDGRRRPLGIPVILDRCLQGVVLGALEPEWEARFEPRSYGFRPGRGCHDAIESIYLTGKGPNPRRPWVLDADLAAAFDRIDHDHLLRQLGTFPARELVAQWLRAGVVEDGRFTPTGEGTPQGGVISPALMNVALHGMEEAAGVRYHVSGVNAGSVMRKSPVLVRYADDLVAMCYSREQAEEVKQRLAAWLEPRGLAFNEDKTRIVHLTEGFCFLGFHVRLYRNRKLLIKPSKASIKRIRKRLAAEMRDLRGSNADAVIRTLNPIIRGWSAYFRIGVSNAVFNSLDFYMWKLAYKWAKHEHAHKSRDWIVHRYFGAFNPRRSDRWVFGDRDSGRFLTKFAWTKIVRHQLVKLGASPDDPALTEYWARRRRKAVIPLIDKTDWHLLKRQNGRCPLCGALLLHADDPPSSPTEWEQWLRATRRAITRKAIVTTGPGTPDAPPTALLHAHCRRRRAAAGSGPALLPAREP
ncbi:group II intron reverse transcriptase/maturase [Streptomyces sp. NPDC090026]|uniref:group II intron reverse transcriptase/maturase n=1 Tax=Streptomyces sp. NPDC090026 TaxID=3365923 RepID=UPI0038114066